MDRIGIDYIITGRAEKRVEMVSACLRKGENNSVNSCMDYKVDGIKLEVGQRKVGVRLYK